MEIFGDVRRAGAVWRSLEILEMFGDLWRCVEINGDLEMLEESKNVCGKKVVEKLEIWRSLKMCGDLWRCVENFGDEWRSLEMTEDHTRPPTLPPSYSSLAHARMPPWPRHPPHCIKYMMLCRS